MQGISWGARRTCGACWAVIGGGGGSRRCSHGGHYCTLLMHTTRRSAERKGELLKGGRKGPVMGPRGGVWKGISMATVELVSPLPFLILTITKTSL